MKRTENRFDRLRRRLAEIHRARLTPAAKRAAWADFQGSGRLPDDPDLRSLCEKLQQAQTEFDQIHTLAPASSEV